MFRRIPVKNQQPPQNIPTGNTDEAFMDMDGPAANQGKPGGNAVPQKPGGNGPGPGAIPVRAMPGATPNQPGPAPMPVPNMGSMEHGRGGQRPQKDLSKAYAKLIDVTRCTGCRGCQVACKQWNSLPAQIEKFNGSYQTHRDTLGLTYTIVKFQEVVSGQDIKWLFRKHQCLHCGKAPCVQKCPHWALSYTEVGSVVRDYNKCASCGTCIAVCPYGVPKRDYTLPRKNPRQCVFCYDRVINGLTPACAKTCPANVISFGTLDAMLAEAGERVKQIKGRYPQANVYGDNNLDIGPTSVIYVLGYPPKDYGLVPKTGGGMGR